MNPLKLMGALAEDDLFGLGLVAIFWAGLSGAAVGVVLARRGELAQARSVERGLLKLVPLAVGWSAIAFLGKPFQLSHAWMAASVDALAGSSGPHHRSALENESLLYDLLLLLDPLVAWVAWLWVSRAVRPPPVEPGPPD